MNIRPKTKRRVSYLFAGIVLVVGASSGFYGFRMEQINASIKQQKIDGMKALERGDYETAYNKLSYYVRKRKHDAESLLALGVSRSNLPRLDGSDLSESINIYHQYCTMEPDDLAVKHQLLQMELRDPPYAGQAISLANSLLEKDPNDQLALKAVAKIDYTKSQNKDARDAALAAAVRYTALDDTDLEIQRLTLALMHLSGSSAADLHARANALAKAHPDDPRFEVLQAYA